ncbi:MAG: multidrug effflux MFS transporter [Bifidobacteriaceae bacterium]|nr:multidrug effflux MFS transporter [Bifidobacteriaceae bacterium]
MPQPALPRTQAGLIVLLGSMTALGAVAGDIYLPSLPEVIADLGTSRQWVQATITATMLGGAVGQLLIGPLSDRYGRRQPVLAGLTLHVAASAAIIFTPSITTLIGLRFLQGIGNASAGVVAMAIIRDLRSGSRAAKLLSQLMLVIGVAPLFAPTIGTALAGLGTWRYAFVFLAVVGLGLGVFVWARVPDTRTEEVKRAATGLGPAFKAYWLLLKDHRFMGYGLIPGLAQSAMMAWVISSPFLIRTQFERSAAAFSLIFALCGVFMVAGAQVNAALVYRFKPKALLLMALPIELGFALVGLAVSFTDWGGLWGMVAGIAAMLFMNGLVPANSSALALSRHGEAAGAASALIGTVQLGFTAVVMSVLSILGDTQREMALVQSVVLAAALAIVLVGGGYRRPGRSPAK